jgi:hypothetical protein
LKNQDGQAVKGVNGTETGAYSCAETVPMTANEFERWFLAHRDDMDETFGKSAVRALLALRAMEAGPAHQCEATDTMNRRDLLAFIRVLRANSVEPK